MGTKSALRVRVLQIGQPIERFESCRHHGVIRNPFARHDQGVRKRGIAVGQLVLEPAPFIGAVAFIHCQKPSCQFLAHLVGLAVACKTPEIFVNTDEREGPCPRAGRVKMAGKACSNIQPAIFWRAGVLERPNTVPSDHKARPWLSSEMLSSSQWRW